MNRQVIHGDRGDLQCFTGTVVLDDTGLIGATVGRLFVQGVTIRIRQVPGPNNRGVPLSSVDGRTARLCGTFVVDGRHLLLSVTSVQPLLY